MIIRSFNAFVHSTRKKRYPRSVQSRASESDSLTSIGPEILGRAVVVEIGAVRLLLLLLSLHHGRLLLLRLLLLLPVDWIPVEGAVKLQ